MTRRTIQQNKSLHKGCQQIAQELINGGFSLQTALQNLDVPPTMETIKSAYRAIAKSMFEVESTTELETNQINKVWDVLLKTIGENTGITIDFPSRHNTDEYYQSLEQSV